MFSLLRVSLRGLAASRGFAFVAVLTLAVGIGSTTAIFSALQALVLKPFNYPAADRLVHVWSGNYGWPLSPADTFDLKESAQSFVTFGVYQPASVNVGENKAQAVRGIEGTSEVLRAFGAAPKLGRLFEPGDEVVGATPVVILSHSLWRSLFGGDAGAIGRKLRLNGTDATVVGVMPEDFEFVSPWMRTADCQIWLPRIFDEATKKRRDNHYLLGIARLKDGVSVEEADAEIKLIGKRLSEQYPDTNARKSFRVVSLHETMTQDIGGQVWLLFGAVALVLLVACGNVASMLLARSARRQGEFAVRVALGASRRDLLQLALSESLGLAALGAAGGLVIAYLGVEVLQAYAPVSASRKAAMALDPVALGFGLLATGLTALLAGLPPAFAAMRTSLASVIRGDARGSVGSPARHRMLRTLIIAQVAVAFVLANGAVLFSQAYLKLIDENRLLDTDAIVTGQISLNGERYKEEAARIRFWREVVERTRALPGVTHAAVTSKLPLEGGSNTNALVNDETYDPTQQRLQVERTSITEEYFATMGLSLIKGRVLQAEDAVGDIRGVVVNQQLVAKAWPDKDPIGEILRGNNPGKPWYTARVVGVVENVKQWGADKEVQPEMYTMPEGHWGRQVHLVLRSPVPLAQLAPLLHEQLAMIDRELALRDVRTMRQVVGQSLQGRRVVAGLVNFFMATALGLVAVGLYGTLSYHVQQRTREIGVRVAIGALRGDILRMVMGQGSRWVAVGLGLGLAGSFALSSALQSVVYRMDGLTALPLVTACVVVGSAALGACWLPARRAATVDPLVALRAD